MEKNLGIILNQEAEQTLRTANQLAENSEFVSLEHVLLALIENQNIRNILTSYQVDIQTLKKDLNEFLRIHIPIYLNPTQKQPLPDFTLAFLRLLQRADIQVHGSGQHAVNLYHLLIALFEEKDSFAVYFLEKQGLTQFDVIYYTTHGTLPEQDSTNPLTTPLEKHRRKTLEKRKLEPRTHLNIPSPIQRFTTNLNTRAKRGDFQSFLNRETILNKIVRVLSRKTKNNPLLVGDTGVGKTTLAFQLAHKIVFQEEVPKKLKDSIIYTLDLGSILAGTKYRGDFEERFKALLTEFKNEDKHVILFIDDIHNLIGAGGTTGSSIDASNLLKPSLSDGTISCIGTTSYKESRQRFEKDRGLVRRFQKIDVLEPSAEKTLQILNQIKKQYELFHNTSYTQSALKSIVDLSGRYLQERKWPDKAIDVMDEVGAHLKLKNKKSSFKILVRDIEKVVAEMAQVPLDSISSSDKQKLLHLESSLKSVIFGQDPAIQCLVSSIKKARIGIGKVNKPIGNYFFSGPTGVGKTEMAKQLAHHLGIHFIRLDMSEYMEKHSVARLLGAPPGYVGHEEGGLLTEQIRQHPHCVLLMDEIEKANLDLTNILLQVMDSGRLTDSSGNSIDFSHVVLIMTSNVGAFESRKQGLGIRPESRSQRSLDALKHSFRPEFLNRLDAVVEFKALEKPILLMVIKKFMNEFYKQLKEKKVHLKYGEEVIEWIFKKGYAPEYGARAFERAVDQYVKNPLVDNLLFGNLSHGGNVILKIKDQKLDFQFTN